MNEDDDYMSNSFIEKSESVRPGLVTGRLAKVYKKQNKPSNVTKSIKTLQEESRQKCLKNEISSDNVGFKLLSKMGFSKETGIGKKGNGIKEPISVVLKSDRTGLGHSSALKRNKEQRILNESCKRSLTEEQWKQRQRQKVSEIVCDKDLRNSQKACLQLDQTHKMDTPMLWFYWPSVVVKEEEEEAEDKEYNDDEEENEEEYISNEEKLEKLTNYLRDKYLFCVWCGIQFKDRGDIEAECPGNTAASHDDD